MTTPRYRRHPAAVWRATQSFLVAAVPPAPPTRISGSAGAVWRELATPRTVEEVVAALAAALPTDGEAISADIESLVTELVRLGLAEAVSND